MGAVSQELTRESRETCLLSSDYGASMALVSASYYDRVVDLTRECRETFLLSTGYGAAIAVVGAIRHDRVCIHNS